MFQSQADVLTFWAWVHHHGWPYGLRIPRDPWNNRLTLSVNAFMTLVSLHNRDKISISEGLVEELRARQWAMGLCLFPVMVRPNDEGGRHMLMKKVVVWRACYDQPLINVVVDKLRYGRFFSRELIFLQWTCICFYTIRCESRKANSMATASRHQHVGSFREDCTKSHAVVSTRAVRVIFHQPPPDIVFPDLCPSQLVTEAL